MPRTPNMLDRLYRWESASRTWSVWRQFGTLLLLELPGAAALLALRFGEAPSATTRNLLYATVWLSTAAMLGWGLYALARTLAAAWKAVRGRPHELQSWREP